MPTDEPIQPIRARPDWQQRLAIIVETMREMSRQTEPQAMVRAYSRRMNELAPTDRFVALSRRDLEPPKYRITRCSLWEDDINPWKEKHRLPVFDRGLLGELLYSDEPRILDEITLAPDDPAAEYFAGQRSLMALPTYDAGVANNMAVLMRNQPAAFPREEFPEWVWMSNLFGRATHNLVLAEELEGAYKLVDRELQVVADIQKSLLPVKLPEIPTLALAAHYETSQRAGGDYYDFFPLPENQWGVLIADVSGHGTPAAVVMAITHSIAHTYPGPPTPPNRLLDFLNRHLAARYTGHTSSFVTAFYGIYDASRRELTYACAGHNPPRLKRAGSPTIGELNRVAGLPLGVRLGETYETATASLATGDQIVFYTDGITEAINRNGDLFAVRRLDALVAETCGDSEIVVQAILRAMRRFTDGASPTDDRTILVAQIR